MNCRSQTSFSGTSRVGACNGGKIALHSIASRGVTARQYGTRMIFHVICQFAAQGRIVQFVNSDLGLSNQGHYFIIVILGQMQEASRHTHTVE